MRIVEYLFPVLYNYDIELDRYFQGLYEMIIVEVCDVQQCTQ